MQDRDIVALLVNQAGILRCRTKSDFSCPEICQTSFELFLEEQVVTTNLCYKRIRVISLGHNQTS